jgi:hypothetical protein
MIKVSSRTPQHNIIAAQKRLRRDADDNATKRR